MDAVNDPLLTIEEVSKITRVPVPTLRYWRSTKTGGPRSANLGGRVVYKRSAVEEWINQAFGVA
jgi:predicted DNA-binding transcriptional regulator AlpA